MLREGSPPPICHMSHATCYVSLNMYTYVYVYIYMYIYDINKAHPDGSKPYTFPGF